MFSAYILKHIILGDWAISFAYQAPKVVIGIINYMEIKLSKIPTVFDHSYKLRSKIIMVPISESAQL